MAATYNELGARCTAFVSQLRLQIPDVHLGGGRRIKQQKKTECAWCNALKTEQSARNSRLQKNDKERNMLILMNSLIVFSFVALLVLVVLIPLYFLYAIRIRIRILFLPCNDTSLILYELKASTRLLHLLRVLFKQFLWSPILVLVSLVKPQWFSDECRKPKPK